MKFNKNDPRINRDGRPTGSKNKVRATRDVKKAVSAGMSLEEICSMLSQTIANPETSETQKNQALKQLIDLKKFLTTTELKLIDDRIAAEEKQGSQSKPTQSDSKVTQFPRPVFKKKS